MKKLIRLLRKYFLDNARCEQFGDCCKEDTNCHIKDDDVCNICREVSKLKAK